MSALLRYELDRVADARQAAEEEARQVAAHLELAARRAETAAGALLRLGRHLEHRAPGDPVVVAARETVACALGHLAEALAGARRPDLARLAALARAQATRMRVRPPDRAEVEEWATAWSHWSKEATR